MKGFASLIVNSVRGQGLGPSRLVPAPVPCTSPRDAAPVVLLHSEAAVRTAQGPSLLCLQIAPGPQDRRQNLVKPAHICLWGIQVLG